MLCITSQMSWKILVIKALQGSIGSKDHHDVGQVVQKEMCRLWWKTNCLTLWPIILPSGHVAWMSHYRWVLARAGKKKSPWAWAYNPAIKPGSNEWSYLVQSSGRKKYLAIPSIIPCSDASGFHGLAFCKWGILWLWWRYQEISIFIKFCYPPNDSWRALRKYEYIVGFWHLFPNLVMG